MNYPEAEKETLKEYAAEPTVDVKLNLRELYMIKKVSEALKKERAGEFLRALAEGNATSGAAPPDTGYSAESE